MRPVAAEVSVTAVFDHDPATRKEFLELWGERWAGVREVPSFEALLATRLDILCLATRQGLHAEQIEAAAAAGVHGIVVEKPLCTILAEADRIFVACEQTPFLNPFAFDCRHLTMEMLWVSVVLKTNQG